MTSDKLTFSSEVMVVDVVVDPDLILLEAPTNISYPTTTMVSHGVYAASTSAPVLVGLLPWSHPGDGFDVAGALTAAAVDGKVLTADDVAALRGSMLGALLSQGAAMVAIEQAWLERQGLVVSGSDAASGTVYVHADAAAVAMLEASQRYRAIERMTPLESDCGIEAFDGSYSELAEDFVDGIELASLIQTQQFYDAGVFGEGSVFALAESGAATVFRNHPGLKDGSGVGRFVNCPNAATSPCSNVQPPRANRIPHATAVASVLLGDITLGQDTLTPETDPTRRAQRSGVARRARGFGFAFNVTDVVPPAPGQPTGLQTSVDQLLLRLGQPDTDTITMVSHSASNKDLFCTGTDVVSQQFNRLFEAGLAVFNSTSNDAESGAGCDVGAPGSALGVFAVNQNVYDVDRSPVLAGQSATGGADDGRSIVAMTAPTPIRYPYAHFNSPIRFIPNTDPRTVLVGGTLYGFDPDNLGEVPVVGGFCCSSAATPVVAGAAGVLRSWWLDRAVPLGLNPAQIDNPGVLYALMLLMGDGRNTPETAPAPTFDPIGYDPRWGAGALRMRMLEADGLDWPWGWDVGSVCVGTGDVVTVPIAEQPLSADVDVLKAVTWTYRQGHAYDGIVPNVDLHLVRGEPNPVGIGWPLYPLSFVADIAQDVVPPSPDVERDNKRRVGVSNAGGFAWRLRIVGERMGSGTWGNCGAGKKRVWYAWMYEDSDRELNDVPECVPPEWTP